MQAKKALDAEQLTYILEVLLLLKDDCPIYSWLQANGIETLDDVLSLSHNEIDTSTHRVVDPDNNAQKITAHLHTGHRGIIKCLVWYSYHLNTTVYINEDIPWLELTTKQFSRFRRGEYRAYSYRDPSDLPTTDPNRPTVKKTVKVVLLEPTLPARELEMGSDSASVTVTHSQGDENVQPSVIEDVKVVLPEPVLPARQLEMGSDSASVTVTHSQGDENTQPSVIDKTHEDAPDTKTILECITSARLEDFRGTSHNFVLNLLEQVRRYNSYVKVVDKLHDGTLYNMLCTAVRSEHILANVENNCELVRNLVSYEQYIRLLESACTNLDTSQNSPPLCQNRNSSPNVNREHDISFRHHLAAYSHDLAYFPCHVPPDILCQSINATEHEIVFDWTTDVLTLQPQKVEVSISRDIDTALDPLDPVPTRQTTIRKLAQSWVEVARMPRLDQKRFPMMPRWDRKHFPMSRLQKRVPRLNKVHSSKTPSRPPDTLAPLHVVSVAEIIAPFHSVDVGRDDPGSLDVHQNDIDTSVDHGSGQASDSLLARSTVSGIEEATDIRIVVQTALKKTVVVNGIANNQSLVPYNADTVKSGSHFIDKSLQDNTPHLRGVVMNGLISDHDAQVKPRAVTPNLFNGFVDYKKTSTTENVMAAKQHFTSEFLNGTDSTSGNIEDTMDYCVMTHVEDAQRDEYQVLAQAWEDAIENDHGDHGDKSVEPFLKTEANEPVFEYKESKAPADPPMIETVTAHMHAPPIPPKPGEPPTPDPPPDIKSRLGASKALISDYVIRIYNIAVVSHLESAQRSRHHAMTRKLEVGDSNYHVDHGEPFASCFLVMEPKRPVFPEKEAEDSADAPIHVWGESDGYPSHDPDGTREEGIESATNSIVASPQDSTCEGGVLNDPKELDGLLVDEKKYHFRLKSTGHVTSHVKCCFSDIPMTTAHDWVYSVYRQVEVPAFVKQSVQVPTPKCEQKGSDTSEGVRICVVISVLRFFCQFQSCGNRFRSSSDDGRTDTSGVGYSLGRPRIFDLVI